MSAPTLPPPVRKPNRRLRVSLRLEDWPKEDYQAWCDAFQAGDFFDETRGPAAHLRPRSRNMLSEAYGRWLGYLERTTPGTPRELIAERVTRGRISTYSHHLAETNTGISVTVQLRRLRASLKLLAPVNDWSWLLTTAKRIEAQSWPRSKRDRLRTVEELWALGSELMGQAEAETHARGGRPTKKGALRYRDGLIISLLVFAPLRRANLGGLSLNSSLIRSGQTWSMVSPAHETKGGRALEYELTPGIGRALELFLAVYRPAIYRSEDHQGLWASAKGVPLTGNALYDAVCRRTKAAFGKSMNVHLFRDAAATLWALDAPEQVRGASQLLGHRHPRTTNRHYNQANSVSAGRTLCRVLDRLTGP